MALLPPTVAAMVASSLVGAGVAGVSSAQMSFAVANGFASYMLSGPVVVTADAGSLGAGVGTGFGLALPPPSLIAAMQSSFSANGINGPMSRSMAVALAVALCQALLTAQIQTADAGVGVGTGTVVSVVPAPFVSIPAMVGSFLGSGLAGPSSLSLATAIAQAVDQALPSARGQTVIAGPSSPFPGGGAGLGRVL